VSPLFHRFWPREHPPDTVYYEGEVISALALGLTLTTLKLPPPLVGFKIGTPRKQNNRILLLVIPLPRPPLAERSRSAVRFSTIPGHDDPPQHVPFPSFPPAGGKATGNRTCERQFLSLLWVRLSALSCIPPAISCGSSTVTTKPPQQVSAAHRRAPFFSPFFFSGR